ncbi:hypothetical protein QTP88_027525 [Uroleucon formosanum]
MSCNSSCHVIAISRVLLSGFDPYRCVGVTPVPPSACNGPTYHLPTGYHNSYYYTVTATGKLTFPPLREASAVDEKFQAPLIAYYTNTLKKHGLIYFAAADLCDVTSRCGNETIFGEGLRDVERREIWGVCVCEREGERGEIRRESEVERDEVIERVGQERGCEKSGGGGGNLGGVGGRGYFVSRHVATPRPSPSGAPTPSGSKPAKHEGRLWVARRRWRRLDFAGKPTPYRASAPPPIAVAVLRSSRPPDTRARMLFQSTAAATTVVRDSFRGGTPARVIYACSRSGGERSHRNRSPAAEVRSGTASASSPAATKVLTVPGPPYL